MAVAKPISLDRMVRAVERVRERLLRMARALEAAGVPYAVAGGNAVAAWVSTVDEGAVRNTRDVDVMIRRQDLEAAKQALTAAGFHYRRAAGMDMFLDSPSASARDGVHLIFADEMVRRHEPGLNPSIEDAAAAGEFRVLSLDALVRIKLTAFRDKHRTHLRDMLEVGLIDETWTAKLPDELARRLQSLIDDPDG